MAGTGTGQIGTYAAPANTTGSAVVGTVSVVATLDGCEGAATTFDITISPTPTISLAGTDPSTCNGVDGSVLVSGSGSGDVSWSGTAVGSATSVNLAYNITGLSSGGYDVVFTDGTTGCESATESVSLNNPGAPVITPILDTISCGGSYEVLAITGTGLINAQYYDAPGGPSGGGNVVGLSLIHISEPTRPY